MKFLFYLAYCLVCLFAAGEATGANPPRTEIVIGGWILACLVMLLFIFGWVYNRNPKISSHIVKYYTFLSVVGFIIFFACASVVIELIVACTQYDSVSEYLANDWFAISSSS